MCKCVSLAYNGLLNLNCVNVFPSFTMCLLSPRRLRTADSLEVAKYLCDHITHFSFTRHHPPFSLYDHTALHMTALPKDTPVWTPYGPGLLSGAFILELCFILAEIVNGFKKNFF